MHPDATVWYRDVEAAFDSGYMLRLGIPADKFDYGDSVYCVEDVFEEITKLIEAEKRGLYVIDSLDALSDHAEMKRDMDEGTYGADKPKLLSQLFRRLNGKMSRSGITVLVVSQVRDNIGVVFGERHTRSGGKALDFYASQIVWLSQIRQLKRVIRKVERPIGIEVKAKVKKNKVGPPFREATFPILFDYGVEDVIAAIQWLQSVNAVEEAGLTADDCKALSTFRAIGALDSDKYNCWRITVSKAVEKIWARIEKEFIPTRRKY
jgi:recombination protein RecA